MPALRCGPRSLRRTYEYASLGGALRALALSLLRSRRDGADSSSAGAALRRSI